MAKRKKKEPLKNYTLDDLLHMTWDDINKMSARDLRHAVRTLNLEIGRASCRERV